MPHECVDCGDVFDDGSDEVFEGCPSCGGTKFFYVKQVSDSPNADNAASTETDAGSRAGTESSLDGDTDTPTPSETAAPPTQTGGGDDGDIVEADSDYERAFGGRLNDDNDAEDDGAQEDADTVSSSDDLQEVDDTDATFRRARADEAKRHLMDQFETIRIVEPGSYELNLMNLYEEDEKIIALQEDGRYQVSLPTALDD